MCSSNTPETERGVIPVVVVVGRGGVSRSRDCRPDSLRHRDEIPSQRPAHKPEIQYYSTVQYSKYLEGFTSTTASGGVLHDAPSLSRNRR